MTDTTTHTKYVSVDPETLDKATAYSLITSLLVPRPVAWVATIGPDGVPNCAPFSFFMGVSSQPPVVAFSVGQRRTGPKDTVRNIEGHPEFTVNICNEELAEHMVQTAADYPYGQSEFEKTGLKPLPSEIVKAPRIGGAPVQMECTLYHLHHLEGTGATVIFGRVVRYHLDETVVHPESGLVDIRKLRPVGRLGGNEFCRVRDVFEIAKPRA